jgi:zinc D-Ala-D-Ala carboxypeptidase
MQLTEHFSLAELTASATAAQQGIDNTPSAVIVKNLTRTAQILERVRVLLGSVPMRVSSGYRCPALNAAVGGVRDSAHLNGLAADFVCPGFGTPLQICRRLESLGVDFDQLIQEGTWVHIGLATDGVKPRRQVLTAHFGGEKPTYGSGL